MIPKHRSSDLESIRDTTTRLKDRPLKRTCVMVVGHTQTKDDHVFCLSPGTLHRKVQRVTLVPKTVFGSRTGHDQNVGKQTNTQEAVVFRRKHLGDPPHLLRCSPHRRSFFSLCGSTHAVSSPPQQVDMTASRVGLFCRRLWLCVLDRCTHGSILLRQSSLTRHPRPAPPSVTRGDSDPYRTKAFRKIGNSSLCPPCCVEPRILRERKRE